MAEPRLATVKVDHVFHCPSCGWVILRTDNPDFLAEPMHCPRPNCHELIKLGNVEVPSGGRTYTCSACPRKLFISPTPAGRVWVFCRNPGCRFGYRGQPQVVRLGTASNKPSPRIVGQVDVTIGAPRL